MASTCPRPKSEIDFEDDDTVLVGTDFGDGSLTDSGYPRLIKRWRHLRLAPAGRPGRRFRVPGGGPVTHRERPPRRGWAAPNHSVRNCSKTSEGTAISAVPDTPTRPVRGGGAS